MTRWILFGLAAALAACGGSNKSSNEMSTVPNGASPQGQSQMAEGTQGKEVSPIPSGLYALTPHLIVVDLASSLEFYQKAFGSRERMTLHDGNGKLAYAEITIGDSVITLGQENPERGEKAPKTLNGSNGFLYLYVEDTDKALQRAEEAGAKVTMKPEDTFWGDRFAVVMDSSGHTWGLATQKFEVSDDEMSRRGKLAAEAMAKGKTPPEFKDGTPAASWKPEKYHTVTPSFVVDGPESLAFYEKAFGAKVLNKIVSPDGTLFHASVRVGNAQFMAQSPMPGGPKPVAELGAAPLVITFYTGNVDDVYQKAIQAGAVSKMQPKDMYWGDRWGMAIDPSGQTWNLAARKENLTKAELERRMRQQGKDEG